MKSRREIFPSSYSRSSSFSFSAMGPPFCCYWQRRYSATDSLQAAR
jgi:hypothetical protein